MLILVSIIVILALIEMPSIITNAIGIVITIVGLTVFCTTFLLAFIIKAIVRGIRS